MVYRTGKPGQDHRVIPAADIEWNDPITKRCPVCLGMKVEQPKKNYRPERPQIWWNVELTPEERAELFSTVLEEPPMEIYDAD